MRSQIARKILFSSHNQIVCNVELCCNRTRNDKLTSWNKKIVDYCSEDSIEFSAVSWMISKMQRFGCITFFLDFLVVLDDIVRCQFKSAAPVFFQRSSNIPFEEKCFLSRKFLIDAMFQFYGKWDRKAIERDVDETTFITLWMFHLQYWWYW